MNLGYDWQCGYILSPSRCYCGMHFFDDSMLFFSNAINAQHQLGNIHFWTFYGGETMGYQWGMYISGAIFRGIGL